jgi:16S rRNA (guanine1516-N2)-methyltransferase
MYPILKKNVKKSGEISAIRSILEIEDLIDDEDNIITNFMKLDCKKLILKRPLKSKKIYSNINYQVKGSTTKFDIYI